MVDFVEICNICARKAIIEAAKRIINSDKVCRSYSDLNFGVTFFGTQCIHTIIRLLEQHYCITCLHAV